MLVADYSQNSAFKAAERKSLEQNAITHVLTVAQPVEVRSQSSTREPLQLKTKQIVLNDDPTEDILAHLEDACIWIEAALNGADGTAAGHVLIHCRLGQSRSGAFLVGYSMSALAFSAP